MKQCKLKTDIIEEIVRRIVSIAQPEKIILFGSYAYGTPDADSDIDLLVIKPGIKSKINEIEEIRDHFNGRTFPSSIKVAERLLTTPTHQLLKKKDREKICKLFNVGYAMSVTKLLVTHAYIRLCLRLCYNTTTGYRVMKKEIL